MPAGSFCGALLVSYVADWAGRKKTVILSGIVWVIGSSLQCAAAVCTLRSFSQAYHILSHHTGPRYADYWPHYLRCFCWDRIDYHSTLSGGNYFTLNPRSSRLCSTMVYYMGNSHSILYPVWLLLHPGYSVFPYSMGSPGNSGHHSFRWHALLPRISQMAS
jgi:hypothetical protein